MAEKELLCVECEDVPACVRCQQCDDLFCGLCYQWQHKKGQRAKHVCEPLPGHEDEAREVGLLPPQGESDAHFDQEEMKETSVEAGPIVSGQLGGPDAADTGMTEAVVPDTQESLSRAAAVPSGGLSDEDGEFQWKSVQARTNFAHSADFIPMRLTAEERHLLDILEGVLNTSEYTDNVDVSTNMFGAFWSSGVSKKTHLMERELKEILSLISGLFVASQYKAGKLLVENQDFASNAVFFQRVFEVGRRYKIMNPDKMRTTYGKLMHLLQDAVSHRLVTFDLLRPISTVTRFLDEHGARHLLEHAAVVPATRVIEAGPRAAEMAQEKARARRVLCDRFATGTLSREAVLLVLDSLADAESFLLANRAPVDAMLRFLRENFDPKDPDPPSASSLKIEYGVGGSKLSHSHRVHYNFVEQSLSLWRQIQHEMYYLWIQADADLLSSHGYRLVNTGQGLNRVQEAPRVARAMSQILYSVKQRFSRWEGLSVVHLGDRDVPNALFFIDKYTQVPRILSPVVRCIEQVAELAQDPRTRVLIDQFGGPDVLRVRIMRDYFRHAKNGSGDDGGSCIDGRLTSAWNWCSKVDRKQYYPAFLITGQTSFDGDWKQ